MITVFVLVGVRLYREGLDRGLAGANSLRVIGSAADPDEALERIATLHPDVLVLDLGEAASLGVAREIRAAVPATKVVALAINEAGPDVVACAEAGVSGYLTRSGSLTELIETIESAARGETRCPPKVVGCLFERLAALAPHYPVQRARITSREAQVVRLIARGMTNKEIARALSIAVPTVKNHVHSVLRKLQVERREDAAGCLSRISVTPPRHSVQSQ
jgi:DNA-binding NarL/FixJ family response regulator